MFDPPPPLPPQLLPPEPMMLDETKSDDESTDAALLSNSKFLTHHEVLRRRSDQAKRLAGIYRSHYWALMEELADCVLHDVVEDRDERETGFFREEIERCSGKKKKITIWF